MTSRAGQSIEAASLDIARYLSPGDKVAWGQAGAEPRTLTEALVAQRAAVGGRFSAFLGASWSETFAPVHADSIDFISYCGTGTNRALADAGALDILPIHYSQFNRTFAAGAGKIDVLLVQVAPPDDNGCYSLSIAHEYLVPLLDSARVVIAEVNAAVPWTHGERTLRANHFDALVHTDRPPLELGRAAAGEVDTQIARHAAALIGDGMTLQCGLGTLPEAILTQLADRRDLGVHSGTIGDAVADLTGRGVITNARKRDDIGVTVAGTMMGSQRIYRFAHRNAGVQFRSTAYTHDIDVLGRIDGFVAINSAIEVDLTGQVNAEVAGGRYVGAVGGAIDFLRGAARSHGGLPLIALPARARGASRIVARLSGPVSTPRSDAGVIVTEYGVADLRGLTLARRVRRMIDIAAPEAREALQRDAAHVLRQAASAA